MAYYLLKKIPWFNAAMWEKEGLFIGQVTEIACTFLVFWAMTRMFYHKPTFPIGFCRKSLMIESAIGLLLGMIYTLFQVCPVITSNDWHSVEFQKALAIEWQHFPYLFAFVYLLLNSINEEVIWRGFICPVLEEKWGSGVMLAFGSLGFGLWHLCGGHIGARTAFELSITGGIGFTTAYLLTRRLGLSIGMHTGSNLVISFLFRNDILPTGFISGGMATLPRYLLSLLLPLGFGVGLAMLAKRRGNWHKPMKKEEQTSKRSASATV